VFLARNSNQALKRTGRAGGTTKHFIFGPGFTGFHGFLVGPFRQLSSTLGKGVKMKIQSQPEKRKSIYIIIAWFLLVLSALSILSSLKSGGNLFFGITILCRNPNLELMAHLFIRNIGYNVYTIVAFFLGLFELKKKNNVNGKLVMYCCICLFIITLIIL
jgi:hypothetical protein